MYKTAGRCPTCGRAEKKPPRSIEQNRYMWGVVYKIIASHTGYTIDEIHEFMKHKFLARTIDIEGEKLNIPTSTTDLDVAQMTDYIEQIREWAFSKLNCTIPDPIKME